MRGTEFSKATSLPLLVLLVPAVVNTDHVKTSM